MIMMMNKERKQKRWFLINPYERFGGKKLVFGVLTNGLQWEKNELKIQAKEVFQLTY